MTARRLLRVGPWPAAAGAALVLCGLAHPASAADAATTPAQAPLHLRTALHLVVDEGPAAPLASPPRQLDWRQLPGTWQPLALPQAPGRPLAVPAPVAQPAASPATRTSWYRWRLPARAAEGAARALYAARVDSTGPVAVYLDGRLVHVAQTSGQPWTGARTPLWVDLPTVGIGIGIGRSAAAASGSAPAGPPDSIPAATPDGQPDGQGHDLLIGLRHASGLPPGADAVASGLAAPPVHHDGPTLSTVRIGTPGQLAWRDAIRGWLQRDLPALGSAAFLTVGLYSLVVWLLRRSDRSYLLFFALSAAAFLRTLPVQADRPIAADAFAWLALNALLWLPALGHVFIRGLHQRPQRGFDAVLAALTVAAGLLTWPGWAPAWPGLAGAVDGLGLAMGATVAGVGWVRCRSRSRDGQWVSVGIGLCVLLDLLDRLPAGGLLPAEGIPLGPYGAVVTFAVFAHLMHRRFSSALREVGDTHRQLALRLQQREAELTETHRRLRAAEQQQTRSQERRRLMQDMHDGLGASLQGALASVAAGPLDEAAIRQLLRGCIDDLRLTIDSMEPVDADLLLLLATLRYRLGGRLQAAGIRLRWEVTDLPRLEGLDPRCALHILRILQETLGNCVQHAQATEIRVQTGFDAHWVQVQITDDGPGFDLPSALRSGGQGLATQLRRAEAIGARVDWQPDPATGRGCCMTLRLPRQAPPGPPPG